MFTPFLIDAGSFFQDSKRVPAYDRPPQRCCRPHAHSHCPPPRRHEKKKKKSPCHVTRQRRHATRARQRRYFLSAWRRWRRSVAASFTPTFTRSGARSHAAVQQRSVRSAGMNPQQCLASRHENSGNASSTGTAPSSCKWQALVGIRTR